MKSLLGLTCTPDHIGFLPHCQITSACGAFVFALWGAVEDKDPRLLPPHTPAGWAADFSWPSSCSRPLSSHPWTSAVARSLDCCSSSVLILVHPTCRCHINTLKTLIDMWLFSWSFNGKPLQGPENSRSWLPFSTHLLLLPVQILCSRLLAHSVTQACAHTVLLSYCPSSSPSSHLSFQLAASQCG